MTNFIDFCTFAKWLSQNFCKKKEKGNKTQGRGIWVTVTRSKIFRDKFKVSIKFYTNIL